MPSQSFHPDYGWEPAIPLPLYTWSWFGLRKRYVCYGGGCNKEFRTELDYEEHYARTHWGDQS